MTISFDLDDTLIPGTKSFETEHQNVFQKIFGIEKIRKGTIALFKKLRSQGHRIYVYTSSMRSIAHIKWLFWSYGIHIDKAINQQIHDKILGESKRKYSKYPPIFGIDLHIDDSEGVLIEGEKFGFRTFILTAETIDWDTEVLSAFNSLSFSN